MIRGERERKVAAKCLRRNCNINPKNWRWRFNGVDIYLRRPRAVFWFEVGAQVGELLDVNLSSLLRTQPYPPRVPFLAVINMGGKRLLGQALMCLWLATPAIAAAPSLKMSCSQLVIDRLDP